MTRLPEAEGEEFLQQAKISIAEGLEEEQLEDLKEALESFFSSLISAIKKAASPQELKRLVSRFGRRIQSVQDLGANVSCISFMLGRLAYFGDEWAKLEENAAPRLPVNLINSKEAELEEIRSEKAAKSSSSQECKQKADQFELESAAIRDELRIQSRANESSILFTR